MTPLHTDANEWRAMVQGIVTATKLATATGTVMEAARLLRASGAHEQADMLIENINRIREGV